MRLSTLKTLGLQLLITFIIVFTAKYLLNEKVSFAEIVIINFMLFYLREGRTVNIDAKSVDVFQTNGNIINKTNNK